MRNASYCVTGIYIIKKGAVKFEGANWFTFFPVEGSFKTVKSGKPSFCSNETTTRQATPQDLALVTVQYEIKTIASHKLLYVFSEGDKGNSSGNNPLFVYQLTE